MNRIRLAQLAIILSALVLCCVVGAVAMALYFNTVPATGPVTISGAAVTMEGVTIAGAGARDELVPFASMATFTLTEALHGQPKMVLGKGADISGASDQREPGRYADH